MNDLIEALQIFAKYLGPADQKKRCPTHCEHDVLSVMDIDEQQITSNDVKRLVELGFFWSDGEECWQSFRFGSA